MKILVFSVLDENYVVFCVFSEHHLVFGLLRENNLVYGIWSVTKDSSTRLTIVLYLA